MYKQITHAYTSAGARRRSERWMLLSKTLMETFIGRTSSGGMWLCRCLKHTFRSIRKWYWPRTYQLYRWSINQKHHQISRCLCCFSHLSNASAISRVHVSSSSCSDFFWSIRVLFKSEVCWVRSESETNEIWWKLIR